MGTDAGAAAPARRARGLAAYARIFGVPEEQAAAVFASRVGPVFAEEALVAVGGDAWTHPALSGRDRSIAVITTLVAQGVTMQPGEIAAMTPADHARAFTAFIAGVLDHFDRYIATGPAKPDREAGYQMGAMWLTDEEYAQFLIDLTAGIQPRIANSPGRGRRRRILYGIALPDPGQASAVRPRRRRGKPAPQTQEIQETRRSPS